jgi:hypothetical protein
VTLPDLPPPVARGWRPREEAWARRAPSAYAGRPGRPLLIGGCPRSGTTLLQVTLDMHPEIGIPRETNFIRELWWQRTRFGDLADPGNRRRVAEWVFGDRAHRTRRLTHKRLDRRQAIAEVAAAAPTIGSVVERCIRLHAHDTPRWGDKRPAYSGFVEPLFRMFPDALYVNIVRDPRGATASQLTMGWDEPEVAVATAAVRWEFAIRATDRAARALRPDQFLDVRYEDLVTDPERQLERILAFAGLSSSGRIIERLAHGERDGWFRGPHQQAGEPVTAAPVERWRERLTPADVALVEHVAAPFMERFGYVPAAAAPPAEGDAQTVARLRRAFRRQWWRSRRDERIRRARYRRPVAAAGHD